MKRRNALENGEFSVVNSFESVFHRSASFLPRGFLLFFMGAHFLASSFFAFSGSSSRNKKLPKVSG
jgi:hypothetical protein